MDVSQTQWLVAISSKQQHRAWGDMVSVPALCDIVML